MVEISTKYKIGSRRFGLINWIGAWTLYKKENSSEKFSNLLPEEKIEYIKSLPAEKQKLYHSVFISQIDKIDGEWDENYIMARAKDMAKTCYYEIYKF